VRKFLTRLRKWWFGKDPAEIEKVRFAEAAALIIRFRAGGQAELQDVLDACTICDELYDEVFWDHAQAALQNQGPSAA
jgi:hypothetical protein